MEEELQNELKELKISMAIEIAGKNDNKSWMTNFNELIEMERNAPTNRNRIAAIEKLLRQPVEGLRKRIWVCAYRKKLDTRGRTIGHSRSSSYPDTRTEEERLADAYFFDHLFDEEHPPILGETVFESQVIERLSNENRNSEVETSTEPVKVFKIVFTMELLYGRNDNESWSVFYEKVKAMENLPVKEQDAIIHKILSEPIEGIHKRICAGVGYEDPGNFECKIYPPQVFSYAQITGYSTMDIFIE